MTEDNSWRDKYLQLVDEQEQLERGFQAQGQSLKQALSELSFACEGLDTSLDERLDNLRGELREEPLTLDSRSLSGAVSRFEDSRNQHFDSQRQSLASILAGLASLAPEKSLDIEDFKRQLDERSRQWSNYPLLLARLDELTQECFEVLGGKGGASEQVAPRLNADAGLEQGSAKSIETLSAGHADIDPLLSEQFRSLLLNWLADLEPVTGRHRVLDMWRKRLASDLSWANLLDAFEDLRALVLVGYNLAGQSFSRYLQELNSELSVITSLLQNSVGASNQLDAAGKKFSQQIGVGLGQLNQSLSSVVSVEQLQGQVAEQVEQMQRALVGFQEENITAKTELDEHSQALEQKLSVSEAQVTELTRQLAQEREKSMTDPLTQLPNRQSYMERSDQEWQRWQRYGGDLTLALIDIDHFKQINDRYGHPAGDRVLAVVAKIMRQRLRQVDFIARIGGEEFAILLPETAPEAAQTLLNKLRQSLADVPLSFKGEPLTVTVSVGVAAFAKGEEVDTVYQRADQALYRAKNSGRNRCEQA